MRFSGERLTSAIGGQVEIEHLHRYFVARDLCRGRDVLDVACGEGYGSALLAQVARSVTGLDYDGPAVSHARQAFAADALFFAQGDATRLPFKDASFDAVVSFETIEHFAAHDAFLAEIRRVLRPGGLLVASSPDRDFYSGPGSQPNPFHVRELNRAEFCALLGGHFAHVATTLQRPVTGSVLMPAAEGGPCLPSVFERREDDLVRGSLGLPHAMYVVSVASDRPVSLPPSLYIDNSDLDGPAARLAEARLAHESAQSALTESLLSLETELAALEMRFAQARADAAREQAALSAALSEAHSQAAAQGEARLAQEARAYQAQTAAAAELAELRRSRAALDGQLAEAAAERGRLCHALHGASQAAASAESRLAALEASTMWKATWPLRRLAGRTPRVARFGRRAAQIIWWSVSGQMPQRLRWWRHARQARAVRPASTRILPAESPIAADIVLPRHDRPVVCVIIPSYGQVDCTLRCLAAIAASPPLTPFEVLVAEDCSGDPAVSQLRRIANLRLVETPTNLGFLLNCNQAAAKTSAEFVMFLNNDTEVQPGWLDALVDLLRRREDAGAAGAKLIFPDGRLQEAGGIIWDDASGWNYGRLDDPDKPVYNYVREADYSSGAALLVRKNLFDALGGFDPAYAPAYYEDTDLAFRLRRAGHKMLYQPRSVVVHVEGVSHGTDIGAGIKAHQLVNQRRMQQLWQSELSKSQFPNGTHVLRARDRAQGRRVVLVIDHYVPQPDRDAGSCAIMAAMRALQQAGRIVKFWTDNAAYSPGYTEALQDAGIEVLYGPSTGGFETWIAENGADIDGALLSRPHIVEKYIAPLRQHSRARLVYYGHDLHGARLRRQALATEDAALAAEADAMESQERKLWRLVDVVLYLSAEEAAEAARLEPGIRVHDVVPYAFTRFGAPREPPPGQKILFVAGFAHPPNEDAAQWFVTDIFPLLRAKIPGAEFQIVGSNPTARVKALAGEGVTVAANVSEDALAAYYLQARVAAVPLRYGAGVKLKVVEALASGLPLVTTGIGAQGCEGVEQVMSLAQDPNSFAAAIGRLLSCDTAWRAASSAQMAYARERFSEARLRARLLDASGL